MIWPICAESVVKHQPTYYYNVLACVCCVQPEPFFLTFALYNAKEGKKISEDFHFNANSSEIRRMLPSDVVHSTTGGAGNSRPTANGVPAGPRSTAVDVKWLQLQNQVSTLDPHL